MKTNTKSITMRIGFTMLAVLMMFGFNSCKKSDKSSGDDNQVIIWSPDPVNGEIPNEVLPEELHSQVCEYFTLFSGDNPVQVDGQFVSKPHRLLYTTVENDTVEIYNDRYICFVVNHNGGVDFYGKQWDDQYQKYYEEVFRDLKRVGEGDNFTCYYLTEAYPDGLYALQSTIFSGKWNQSYGGLKDFQVAVVLLETSGNPNLAPVNSFRILGDGDGLAADTAWLYGKAPVSGSVTPTDFDPFQMFRVK